MMTRQTPIIFLCLFAGLAGCTHPSPFFSDGAMESHQSDQSIKKFSSSTDFPWADEENDATADEEDQSGGDTDSGDTSDETSETGDDSVGEATDDKTNNGSGKGKNKEHQDAGRGNGDDAGDPGRSGDVNQGGDETG